MAASAGLSDTDLARRRTGPGAGDLATIIYTSGTTGRPKGCEITHGNLLATARNVVQGPLSVVFETPGASTMPFLPLAHSFARIIQVGALEGGAVLGHTFDVANLLPELAAFRPTFLLAVPRVFEKFYGGAEQQASQNPVRAALFRAARARRSTGVGPSGCMARTRAPGRDRRCGCATPSSTCWCIEGCVARSVAASTTRCPAGPPSGNGSPFLPRGGGHHHGGVGAHRDHRPRHGEPTGP